MQVEEEVEATVRVGAGVDTRAIAALVVVVVLVAAGIHETTRTAVFLAARHCSSNRNRPIHSPRKAVVVTAVVLHQIIHLRHRKWTVEGRLGQCRRGQTTPHLLLLLLQLRRCQAGQMVVRRAVAIRTATTTCKRMPATT